MDRAQQLPWAVRYFHAIGAVGAFTPFSRGAPAQRPMRHFALTVCALAASTFGFAAETLIPDPTFGSTVLGIPGRTFANTQGMSPRWSAGKLDANGKLVVAGTSCTNGSNCTLGRDIVIARLNTDGTLDTSFNAIGVTPGRRLYSFGPLTPTAGYHAEVSELAIDSAGRYVIAGIVGQNETFVARFLPTGALDATFAPGAASPGIYRRNFGAGQAVQTMTLDTSDRPVVAGHVNGVPFVARLTVSGGTDFTFNAAGPSPGLLQFTSTLVPGFAFGSATSISFDANQNIVIAGLQNTGNYFQLSVVNRGNGYGLGIGAPFVARVASNGILDPSFGSGTWPGIAQFAGFNQLGNRFFRGRVGHLIDSNDRIVIGGLANFVGQSGPVAFRLTSNGVEDPTAYTYSPNWPINASPFTPVSSLAPIGIEEFSSGQIGMDGAGNVYIGATYSFSPATIDKDSRLLLFRATANLQPDSTFVPDVAGNPPTRGVHTYDVSEGRYTWINGTGNAPDPPLFLLDASHGVAYLSGPGKLKQGDGPILRVTTSAGALDPTFGQSGIAFTGGIGTGFAEVNNRALVTLADGRSIVVGRHTLAQTANGGTVLSLTRFDAAGVLDASFAPVGDPPGQVLWTPSLDVTKFSMQTSAPTVAMLDADGKLVVAFAATDFTRGSSVTTVLVRFLDNGTLDTTFNPGGTVPGMLVRHIGDAAATMTPSRIAQDAQKRYYVAGTTASAIPVNSNTVGFVARYFNDGTIDATLNDTINPFVYVRYQGGSAQSTVEDIHVAADGTILVAGEATGVGAGISRLLTNGSRDPSYNAGGTFPGALAIPYFPIAGLLRLNDGRFITSHRAVTSSIDPDFVPYHYFLRIDANGMLDASYNAGLGYLTPTSICYNNWFVSANRSGGGSYHLCSGYFESVPTGPRLQFAPPVVLRLDANGERATSFGINGEFSLPSTIATGGILARGMTVDAAGAVVIAGQVITDISNRNIPKAQTYIAKFLPMGIFAPPVLQAVASRKVHGGAGTFDLPLSALLTNPTTEPRTGASQTIVMSFDKPILSADNPTVSEGSATFASKSYSGNDVILNFTGVANLQYVTFNLANVASTDGGVGGTGSVRVGYLLGDVNNSRQVTVADVGTVNAALLQSVTNANFLLDVNADGRLTVADKGIANANLLKKLPAP
ncbi:MAG TPA: hypothetical protein PLW68_11740 [Casimicrobiaceae bacterium]|nr:hypothetical protein [Casimicrobiaceae bacterium]